MKETWEKAIEFVLKWEGGYVFNPDDPGGETNFGISKRAHPELDIKNLTKEHAVVIYKKGYWGPIEGDLLPWPLDMIMFDTSVNCGVSRAIWFHDHAKSWVEYLFARIRFYVGLKRADIFLRGWVNRVLDLYEEIKKPPMEVIK